MYRKPKYKTDNKRRKLEEIKKRNDEIELKISLIEKFCRHIGHGFSKNSFVEAAWDEVWRTAQYLDENQIPEESTI
ncbi:MAG: hypothetical protein NTV87_12325, partial [Ignavibacteriae bacterium]|nr:hypothetical protein [Ignavibacteriota bacterium]